MSPALFTHIGAGLIALFAGATALTAVKGNRLHRWSGMVFGIAMLVMAVMASFLSISLNDRGNLPGGLFTAYLVATGWGAIRLKRRAIGAFELWGLAAVLAVTILTLAFAALAQQGPDGLLDGKPAAQFEIFAGFEVIAALLDLKIIILRRLSSAQRMARHIWRMCAALFIASGSFFLGQQKVMPISIQGSPILILLALAPLLLMAFWLWRNRRQHRLPPPIAVVSD